MYINIDTIDCIARLSEFLLQDKNQKHFGYPSLALVEAITIVVKNNRMRFRDLTFQQLVGVAIGICPVPPVTNIYVAIFELENIFGQFIPNLLLYLRFIDNGIAIWEHSDNYNLDHEMLEKFRTTINKSGLIWEFTSFGQSINFMDMKISLGKRKK